MRNRESVPTLGLCALTLVMVCMPAAARETPSPEMLSRFTSWEITPFGNREPAPTFRFKATVSDPVGDTFGTGVPQLDLIEYGAETDQVDLWIRLEFAGPISPADSGQADALVGIVDLDSDQDPGTGIVPFSDVFCPLPTGAGMDFFVDLGSYTAGTGTMDVIDSGAGVPSGTADATFEPTSLSIRIPLAALGGDDGFVDTSTVIGTIPEPTDCAPDGATLTSDIVGNEPIVAIPTLQGWGLAALVVLLLSAGVIVILRSR